MRYLLSLIFMATAVEIHAALEETIDFSGISDVSIGDVRSTMRHAACVSGFFVTSDGYFITDKHLIQGAERLIVVCENKAYEAELVELSDTSRCALLKVKGGVFIPVEFAQDDERRAGERLLVAGFVASDENGVIPQLSWGVVSDRKLKSEIELFTGILPEQVGSLVANGKGQFVGIALGTGKKSQSVCRVLKRSYVDRSLPVEVRRKFKYTAKSGELDFDQMGMMMAKCTGLVLIYDEKRRYRDVCERGLSGKDVVKEGERLKFDDLEKITQKSKDKKTHLARTGSGFFITDDGYFITNHHVIDGAEEVVVLYSNKTYVAEAVARSKDKDLALLKMEGSFVPVALASTNQCPVGHEVFLVGYPRPKLQGLESKVTKGIISSQTGFQGDADLYQIDAAIQGGNSGGPAGDSSGNVVGVAVANLRNAQLVTYIIKLGVVFDFLPKCVKSSVAIGNKYGDIRFTEAVRSVNRGVGMVLVFAKGPGGVLMDDASPDERKRFLRNIRRAILSARSAKLEGDWRTVDEITAWVLEQLPDDSEAKELYDMAQENLGRHLIIRAVLDCHDVKAKVFPVCGFKRNYVNCEEPTELYDRKNKRGFQVIARLSYEKNGKTYEGTLECVFNWSGTREIRVQLNPCKKGD